MKIIMNLEVCCFKTLRKKMQKYLFLLGNGHSDLLQMNTQNHPSIFARKLGIWTLVLGNVMSLKAAHLAGDTNALVDTL
jgi:hypothetical protein